MDGIFHYGSDSEQYICDFESKWADYTLQAIKGLTFEDLRALLYMLRQGNRTFEKSERTKV